MYNSEFALELRRQIAVNAHYICYALRQGQLRLLHRHSAERALLKSKGAAITDVQCGSPVAPLALAVALCSVHALCTRDGGQHWQVNRTLLLAGVKTYQRLQRMMMGFFGGTDNQFHAVMCTAHELCRGHSMGICCL